MLVIVCVILALFSIASCRLRSSLATLQQGNQPLLLKARAIARAVSGVDKPSLTISSIE